MSHYLQACTLCWEVDWVLLLMPMFNSTTKSLVFHPAVRVSFPLQNVTIVLLSASDHSSHKDTYQAYVCNTYTDLSIRRLIAESIISRNYHKWTNLMPIICLPSHLQSPPHLKRKVHTLWPMSLDDISSVWMCSCFCYSPTDIYPPPTHLLLTYFCNTLFCCWPKCWNNL